MNMTKTKKRILFFLSTLLCISCISCICLYRSYNINPDKIEIQYKNIKNENIPEDLKHKSIAFFSDFQYGEFQNQKRSDSFFSKLNHLNPDLVLFGGDLIEASFTPSDQDIQYLIDSLCNIQAPLGKFAVLGEQDITTPERKQLIERIYKESEIEILSNSSHPVSNQSAETMQIIGLSLEPNWNQALATVKKDEFCLLLTHAPDLFLSPELSRIQVDYALAGHSHGTQISFPIYGGYKTISHAEEMNRSNSKKVPFKYHITSGVGCTHLNIRFNANPEIVCLLLN